ncbi:tRNA (adenosine(37)-N6)-dimethylallyltransferase MiaA [Desulfonatronovibrio magnus]|uniref:tRNA (adenosine(37)-N6)-dimethylallyltransferase MiaA n=1 Tax=Desulfonatronovibrio magnus TaxID=698827 RepID=UPI000698F7EE|nr:tRNA (adenosine(37)-N6)-dimethylallyltransferase MiaA [Desulfonatronovibrio magnus]
MNDQTSLKGGALAQLLEEKFEIVCILGPTGSGKNDLALEMAGKIPLEIINFDSRQVYADLPVVTAQPSPEEQLICPHHLYGFLNLFDRVSAGKFVDMATQTIATVHERGNLPVLVGGTGLYLRSLIYGLADIPQISPTVAEELKNQLEKYGVEPLRDELERVDPEYSATISSKDKQKISRALAVFKTTGVTFSQWHRDQNKTPRFQALKIGITKGLTELAPWLRLRIDKMMDKGALDEVGRAWKKSGYNENCPAFSGIGCREIISFLKGDASLEQAMDNWYKSTRAYAKRQLTWFRKDHNVHWLDHEEIQNIYKLFNNEA